MRRSTTITVSIARPVADVYAFVADAANFPTWATSFARAIRRAGDEWIVDTPDGEMALSFVERNAFGVLDHRVRLPNGVEIVNPMRVVPNADGSELMFTLFQTPGISDAQFATDEGMVKRDLETLKRLMER